MWCRRSGFVVCVFVAGRKADDKNRSSAPPISKENTQMSRMYEGIQFAALLAALSGVAQADGLSSDCHSAKAHIPLWQITGTGAGDLCFVGSPPTKAGASAANIRALVVPVKV